MQLQFPVAFYNVILRFRHAVIEMNFVVSQRGEGAIRIGNETNLYGRDFRFVGRPFTISRILVEDGFIIVLG
ncbi:hypothetical protein D3C77_554570 [compost metagenome]